jgi:hypothetical protein
MNIIQEMMFKKENLIETIQICLKIKIMINIKIKIIKEIKQQQ